MGLNRCGFSVFGCLEAERTGAGLFLGIRQVERLAMLATVNFHVGAELLLHFVAEEIPALQMARTELFLFVFPLVILLVSATVLSSLYISKTK